VLILDEEAAHRAAEIRVELESRGEGIGMADYLIAAICLQHSAPLMTRNVRRFGRVAELRLDTPGD